MHRSRPSGVPVILSLGDKIMIKNISNIEETAYNHILNIGAVIKELSFRKINVRNPLHS
jgi:hypothetical protein